MGIGKTGSVAIECGGVTDPDKLPILRAEFDEVIHLPYLDKTLVSEIEGYKREIRSKDRTIGDLRKTVEEMRKAEKREKAPHRTRQKSEEGANLPEDFKENDFWPRMERIEEKLEHVISTLREIVGEEEPEAEEERRE